jgi:hypothetical protein
MDFFFDAICQEQCFGRRIANVALHDVAERFIVPTLDIPAAAQSNQVEGSRDEEGKPDPESVSSGFSYIDCEEVPELIDRRDL